MTAWPDWLPPRDKLQKPIYLAIADAIAAAVGTGRLSAGMRLPPQRQLAELLGINMTTVTRAYDLACQRRHVDARVGMGTYVRAQAPAGRSRRRRGFADMTMNSPPEPDVADLDGTFAAVLQNMSGRDDWLARMRYGPHVGFEDDREAGAEWIGRRLSEVPFDNVAVLPGTQAALLASCLALVGRGGVLLTEDLTYPGIKSLAAHLGFRLEGVATDDEGLDPDAFAEACERLQPSALYCTPCIHNPMTTTLSLERRRAIAETARRHGVYIIEDDIYGVVAESAPPPIAGLAPEISFYVTGLSKSLFPGVRISYVLAPNTEWMNRLSAAIRATVFMPSPFSAAFATELLTNGQAHDLLDGVRREARARQRIAARVLAGQSFRAAPEGHHIWLSLPGGWTRSQFMTHCRFGDLVAVPSDAFAVSRPPPEAVRLSLGAAPSREDLEAALPQLAAALDQMPEMLSASV